MWKWLKGQFGKVKDEIVQEEEEMEEDIVPRTPTEVAERIIALSAVTDKVFGGDHPEFKKWVQENSIEKYLSVEEKDFFSNPMPSENLKINFSWKSEALTALLWATLPDGFCKN